MHKISCYAVFLLLIVLTSCEKKDNSVLDPVLNFPVIDSASISPTLFDTNNIHITAQARLKSAGQIKSVIAQAINPYIHDSLIETIQLHDDGIAPDSIAGDGKYCGYIDFTLNCRRVGMYNINFTAFNNSNQQSNTIVINFRVINSHDHNPGLFNLILNHSIRRPGGDTVKFDTVHISANDPDGNCDIKRVYFNSYNPLNHFNDHNPFIMYDDGDMQHHGDPVAGDYQFSVIIGTTSNPSDTSIGYYKLFFFSQDYSDSLSLPLIDSVNIHR